MLKLKPQKRTERYNKQEPIQSKIFEDKTTVELELKIDQFFSKELEKGMEIESVVYTVYPNLSQAMQKTIMPYTYSCLLLYRRYTPE